MMKLQNLFLNFWQKHVTVVDFYKTLLQKLENH